VEKGQRVPVTDGDGAILGHYPVQRVVANRKKYPGTLLVQVQMERAAAKRAIGIRVQEARVDPVHRL
jgi:hypothetical protein